MIRYTSDPPDSPNSQLTGFFVGWPQPPSPQTLVQILEKSAHVEVAIDTESNRVIGFATAISDGVLSAHITLLEVLPEYQGQGIGSELTRRLIAQLGEIYAIDAVCDDDLVPFYERFGMQRVAGMALRQRRGLE